MLPYLPDFFPQYPGRSELESKIQKAVNPKPMYVQGFNPLFKALNSNAIGTKMSRRDMAQHFGKFAEGHLFQFLRDALSKKRTLKKPAFSSEQRLNFQKPPQSI